MRVSRDRPILPDDEFAWDRCVLRMQIFWIYAMEIAGLKEGRPDSYYYSGSLQFNEISGIYARGEGCKS